MKTPDPHSICFGLSHKRDKESCSAYLQLLGIKECAELLADRLSSEEIEILIDMIGSLLHKHFSKQEYHRLFLLESDHE